MLALCVFSHSALAAPYHSKPALTNRQEMMNRQEMKARRRASLIRQTVLCTLAVQNACQMLSMRYSRMPSQPKYLSSTAVVSAEVVKIVMSAAMLGAEQGLPALELIWHHVVVQWRDTLMVGIPALLYLIQNNLLYVAASHLDAATCQVAYQLKLLTTAFFTVTLLKRHISTRRWGALGLLFLGVVMVQAPQPGSAAGAAQQPILGMAAVAAACLLSGLAGVWLERIVKSTSDVPIWVRNIQLGTVSLALGLASVWTLDRRAIAAAGFFQGYTWLTAFVVLQVSAGGLLVGLIMRYADNVVKGFATSLSIIISSGVSWFIPAFNFEPSLAFVSGSALVIAATILYSSPQDTAKASPFQGWITSKVEALAPSMAPTPPTVLYGDAYPRDPTRKDENV